jgi:NADH-quinone oxidoreductase subunit J
MVHCALCVAGAFAGIALMFLQLDAEFAGFAQVLVYIGAVAILVLFAVLLTRGNEARVDVRIGSRSWFTGLCAAALVFAGIAAPVLMSPSLNRLPAKAASAPVQKIGEAFVNHYAIPLEAVGLLLTAALLGAVVIAMKDPREESKPTTEVKQTEAAR